MRLLALVAFLALAAPATAATDPGSLLPARVDWALLAPQAGSAAAMGARLRDAGASKVGLLRPGGAVSTLVGIDPLDPRALETAGVDPAAPLALASTGGSQLLSVGVTSPDAFARAMAAWLSGVGQAAPAQGPKGWQLHVASKDGKAVAAYALGQGRAYVARAVEPRSDPAAVIRAAIATQPRSSLASVALYRATFAEAAGPWRYFGKAGGGTAALALDLEAGDVLRSRGRYHLPKAADLLGAGETFADPGGGLAVVRASVSPKAFGPRGSVRPGLRWLVRQACPSCGAAEQESLVDAIAELPAGPLALVVDRLDAAAVRRSPDALGPQAFPWLYAVAVRDPAKAGQALERVAARLSARKGEGSEWTAETPIGPLHFGLRGRVLYATAEAKLRDRVLPALGATAAGAPLQLRADPAVFSQGLDGLSMGDALRGNVLALLFTAKLEAGPLLRGSGPLHAQARPLPGGAWRVEASWDLSR